MTYLVLELLIEYFFRKKEKNLRLPGIEPGASEWESEILPLKPFELL